MNEPGYWSRFWRRRLTRRRLLASAAVTGGGLVTAAAVGCGGKSGGPTVSQAPLSPEGIPQGEAVIDARRPVQPAPSGMAGGTLRYIGADPVVLDRFDPHQTQFGPMYSNLSAVFSKLYMYKSHEEPTWENIVPDLAESAPEMIGDPPDIYVIHLRRGVKFHDNERTRKNFPSLAGRELTADDVIFSFERQRNPNSQQRAFYYRRSQYETIDAIKKLDDYTIKIQTKGPVAPFYHFMADTNAMIIPKEIVDKDEDTVDVGTGPKPEERMIGTGPFMWDKLQWGTEFKAVRNPDWFGWGQPELGRPYLDAYDASASASDDATVEALFRAKNIDFGGYVDNPRWILDIKEEMTDLLFASWRLSGWVNSRMKVSCKPFDDIRVRRALHLATDRQQIIDVIGGGQMKMVGPVGGAIKYWAIPEDELEKAPGYRQGPQREQDLADARALYQAAGSPEIPVIWFVDLPGYIPRYAPAYIETMKRNLGIELRTVIKSYPIIFEAFLRGCEQAPMTWAFDNGWIDLDDWVYPYFRSAGPKNSFGVSDPELDGLLDAQRREFGPDRRRELGYEIQRYLLGLKGDKPAALVRLDYTAPVGLGVAWPYLKNPVVLPWFGNNHWYANIWLDRNDQTYQGRPA